MEVHLVDQEVHRDGVVAGDLDDVLIGDDLDVFALDGDFQVFDHFKDLVPYLLFGVVIDDREPGLFLHFVGELILCDVRRQYLEGDERAIDEDGGPKDGLDCAAATLGATAQSICAAKARSTDLALLQQFLSQPSSRWLSTRGDLTDQKSDSA